MKHHHPCLLLYMELLLVNYGHLENQQMIKI